jgi:hypothetical protein
MIGQYYQIRFLDLHVTLEAVSCGHITKEYRNILFCAAASSELASF